MFYFILYFNDYLLIIYKWALIVYVIALYICTGCPKTYVTNLWLFPTPN